MGKPAEEEAPGAPEWLVTFSDLVSLLVTLFIMMLTFSTQETHDLSKAMNMIKGSFGIFGDQVRDAPEHQTRPILQDNTPGGADKFDPHQDPHLEPRLRELTGFVVESSELDGGLRIVPEATSGFGPGDDRPSAELADRLRRLARMLRKHRHRRIVIEGHSDSRSDRPSILGDPESVALARARRTSRLFGLEGVAYENIVVVSKGSRVRRGDPRSESGRARNRRVEIVVLPPAKAPEQPVQRR